MPQRPTPLRPVPTRSPDYIINELRHAERRLGVIRDWINRGCPDDCQKVDIMSLALGVQSIKEDLQEIRSWCEAKGPTSWWREGARERLKKTPLLD